MSKMMLPFRTSFCDYFSIAIQTKIALSFFY